MPPNLKKMTKILLKSKKMTKITPKPKKLPKFPQNLQNDWNILKAFNLDKNTLETSKIPQISIFLI